MATSATDAETLYAASRGGLLISTDGGKSWRVAGPEDPATTVHATGGGEIYAFVVGAGLLRATEPDLDWRPIGGNPGEDYVLHLAVGPGGSNLYAVTVNPQTRTQALRASHDGGATWAKLGRAGNGG